MPSSVVNLHSESQLCTVWQCELTSTGQVLDLCPSVSVATYYQISYCIHHFIETADAQVTCQLCIAIHVTSCNVQPYFIDH